jgi:glycosyltransferase involved in cell wall biosynthesis
MALRCRHRPVQVLLSTYNGASFLEPLLESVFRQDYPAVSILVRDDGSSDATPAILDRHRTDARMRAYRGAHLGAAMSFLDLLDRADTTAAFFAFCDQDDVWLPDKLAQATTRLDRCPGDRPALYCGRVEMVDARLASLGLSPLPRRGPSFRNALVENIATGCTVLMNPAARTMLAEHRPAFVAAHDWWAYLVVAAVGTVVYDATPKVLYRQHETNAIGIAPTRLRSTARRLRHFRRNRQELVVLRQATEFQRLYGSGLDCANARILSRFLARRRTWVASLRYAMRPDVFRQRPLDDLVLKALLGFRLM